MHISYRLGSGRNKGDIRKRGTKNKKISIVLVNGECNVPHEVLLDKGSVSVNLVGSVVEGETLVERMTSYKTKIVEVEQKVNVDGANTVHPTPSEFEQYVAIVDEHIDEKIGDKADKSYVDSEIERVENKIPTKLSELEGDTEHRTVTDAEKEAWNAKSDFSGSYNDLSNVPETFPPSEHNHDTRYYTKAEIKELPLYPRG